MLMNKKYAALAVAAFALALAACSPKEETKPETPPPPAPVQPTQPPPDQTPPVDPMKAHNDALIDLEAHDKSVYFEFDKSTIKPEGQAVISAWAGFLKQYGTDKIQIQGNCDERGTREYNIALGERRAKAVADALKAEGVADSQLSLISYGKEKPVALGHDESAWSQNRRADLVE
jgi:peptidoglycan-associated lipoprotein